MAVILRVLSALLTTPSSRSSLGLILAILILNGLSLGWSLLLEEPRLGPTFIDEPPDTVVFTNNTEFAVHCTVRGNPTPVIGWIREDSVSSTSTSSTSSSSPLLADQITSVSGLREVWPNGTLLFYPFRSEDFRSDLHTGRYRCMATNSIGTIVSRHVQVRAIVTHHYSIQVHDVTTMQGNAAIFQCTMPGFVREFVRVKSWIRNDDKIIEQSNFLEAEFKYILLPTGELFIRDVQPIDNGSWFRCQTVNLLNGELRTSNSSGRLIVTRAEGGVAPKIAFSKAEVTADEFDNVVIPCVAEGNPIPEIMWYARLTDGLLLPIHFGGRMEQLGAGLLIKEAKSADTGAYVCDVKNGYGNARGETSAVIYDPILSTISPSNQTVDVGSAATFRCTVTGHPITRVRWLKDGEFLPTTVTGSVVDNGEELLISSVTWSDAGSYQCLAENTQRSSQATAQLLLGDIAPQFQTVFESEVQRPNANVSLRCSALGSPAPKISWYLEEVSLDRSEGDGRYTLEEYWDSDGSVVSKLRLTDVQTEDGGLYRCMAVNKIGKIEHSARLNVYGSIAIRPMEPVTAVTSQNLTINCPVYGYPIDSIQWWKDGDILPQNLRQLIYPNGTLIIAEVQRGMDAGRYTCIASNNDGDRQEEDAEVNILVRPKILPFTFDDQSVREGVRARLQCAVTEGDSPLMMRWYKDDRLLWPRQSRFHDDDDDDSSIPLADIPSGLTVRGLDEFSSILTIRSVTPQHNGNYTCVASNEAATVSHSAELYINVAPKIIPFSFQGGHLFEGVLARVSCVVFQGDLPLTISWMKDGHPIAKDIGINVHVFDEYSSILTISAVSPKHSGNFTCTARNHAASAVHTAELIVNVPPRWKMKPHDKTIGVGESVLLNCQAEGFPEPKISWMWSNEVSPGSAKRMISNDNHFYLFSNGSLLIGKASEKQQGYYFCRAKNDVGPSISAVGFLAVKFPAKLSVWQTNLTVHHGAGFGFECKSTGDLPINFTWTKGDSGISTEDEYYVTKEVISNDGMTSELKVVSASSNDMGIYSCAVQNAYGSDVSSYVITVQETPDTPSNISVEELGSRFIGIGWVPPFDGRSKITSYTVEYFRDQAFLLSSEMNSDSIAISESIWENADDKEVVQTAENLTVLTDLQPASRYYLRLYASNDVGTSEPSPSLTVITKEEAPSGAPQEIKVESINSKTLNVCWRPPPISMWNGVIKGYWAGFRVWGSSSLPSFKAIHLNNRTKDLCANITGLTKYVRYSIVVQAYNEQGRGPNSEEVMAMTAEGVPSESGRNVTCTVIGSTSVQVTWYPPPFDLLNGLLQGYKIHVEPRNNNTDGNMSIVLNTTAPGITVENLIKFSSYSFKVVAFTKAGDGTPTESVTCRTKEDVPGPPAAFRAVIMSPDAVLVAWKPPIHANGILTHYNVHMKEEWQQTTQESGPWSVTTDVLFYEISNLMENQKYNFWLTASTMAGEGEKSKVITLIPKGPQVPAQVISFDETAIRMWRQRLTLPCKAVGIPKPERRWLLGEATVKPSPKLHILPDGTLLIKDAQGSHSGNYTCIVENRIGKNRIGKDKVKYSVLILAPPAPPAISVNFTTRTSIHLEWIPGSSNGAEIKGYVLNFREKGGNVEEIKLKSDVKSYELSDLQCGTFYELSVLAINDIGEGNASEVLRIATNGSVPLLPRETTGIVEGATTLTVHLDKVVNGDCPVERYSVEYKPKHSELWVVFDGVITTNQRLVVIKQLQPATWYNLRLMAQSTAGKATAEYEVATLGIHGGTVKPGNMETTVLEDGRGILFYIDLRIVIPIAAFIGFLLLALIGMCVCVEKKKQVTQPSPRKTYKVEKSNNSHLARRPQDRDSAVDGFTYLRHNSDPKRQKTPPTSQDLDGLHRFADNSSGTYSYYDGPNGIRLNLRPTTEDLSAASYASYDQPTNRPELQTFQQQRSSAPAAGERVAATDTEEDPLERTKQQLMQQMSRPRSYTPGYANVFPESPSSTKKKLRQVAIPTAPVLPGSPCNPRRGSQGSQGSGRIPYQMAADLSPCNVKGQVASRSITPTSISSTPIVKQKPPLLMPLPPPPRELSGSIPDLPSPDDNLPMPPAFIMHDVSPVYCNVVDSKDFSAR